MKNTMLLTITVLALTTTFLTGRATFKGQVAQAEKTSAGVRAWEYKFLQRSSTWSQNSFGLLSASNPVFNEDGQDLPSTDSPIERLGAKGWELVAATTSATQTGPVAGVTNKEMYIFKRPK